MIFMAKPTLNIPEYIDLLEELNEAKLENRKITGKETQAFIVKLEAKPELHPSPN